MKDAVLTAVNYQSKLNHFFKHNPHIKEQYCINYLACFPEVHKFGQDFIRSYILYLQNKKDIPQMLYYNVKLFFHNEKHLYFSCTIEVAPKYIEIHDVCTAPDFQGKGACKQFMPRVVEFIKKNYTQGMIKIMCENENKAACKCYSNVFGTPVKQARNESYFKYKV